MALPMEWEQELASVIQQTSNNIKYLSTPHPSQNYNVTYDAHHSRHIPNSIVQHPPPATPLPPPAPTTAARASWPASTTTYVNQSQVFPPKLNNDNHYRMEAKRAFDATCSRGVTRPISKQVENDLTERIRHSVRRTAERIIVEKHHSLQKDIDRSSDQIDSLTEDMTRSKKIHESMSKSLSHQDHINKRMKQEWNGQRVMIEKLNSEIKAYQPWRESIEGDLSVLKQQQRDDLMSRVTGMDLQTSIQQVHSDVDTKIERAMKQMKSAFDTEICSLKEEVQSLRTENAILLQELQEKQESCNAFMANFDQKRITEVLLGPEVQLQFKKLISTTRSSLKADFKNFENRIERQVEDRIKNAFALNQSTTILEGENEFQIFIAHQIKAILKSNVGKEVREYLMNDEGEGRCPKLVGMVSMIMGENMEKSIKPNIILMLEENTRAVMIRVESQLQNIKSDSSQGVADVVDSRIKESNIQKQIDTRMDKLECMTNAAKAQSQDNLNEMKELVSRMDYSLINSKNHDMEQRISNALEIKVKNFINDYAIEDIKERVKLNEDACADLQFAFKGSTAQNDCILLNDIDDIKETEQINTNDTLLLGTRVDKVEEQVHCHTDGIIRKIGELEESTKDKLHEYYRHVSDLESRVSAWQTVTSSRLSDKVKKTHDLEEALSTLVKSVDAHKDKLLETACTLSNVEEKHYFERNEYIERLAALETDIRKIHVDLDAKRSLIYLQEENNEKSSSDNVEAMKISSYTEEKEMKGVELTLEEQFLGDGRSSVCTKKSKDSIIAHQSSNIQSTQIWPLEKIGDATQQDNTARVEEGILNSDIVSPQLLTQGSQQDNASIWTKGAMKINESRVGVVNFHFDQDRRNNVFENDIKSLSIEENVCNINDDIPTKEEGTAQSLASVHEVDISIGGDECSSVTNEISSCGSTSSRSQEEKKSPILRSSSPSRMENEQEKDNFDDSFSISDSISGGISAIADVKVNIVTSNKASSSLSSLPSRSPPSPSGRFTTNSINEKYTSDDINEEDYRRNENQLKVLDQPSSPPDELEVVSCHFLKDDDSCIVSSLEESLASFSVNEFSRKLEDNEEEDTKVVEQLAIGSEEDYEIKRTSTADHLSNEETNPVTLDYDSDFESEDS